MKKNAPVDEEENGQENEEVDESGVEASDDSTATGAEESEKDIEESASSEVAKK